MVRGLKTRISNKKLDIFIDKEGHNSLFQVGLIIHSIKMEDEDSVKLIRNSSSRGFSKAYIRCYSALVAVTSFGCTLMQTKYFIYSFFYNNVVESALRTTIF